MSPDAEIMVIHDREKDLFVQLHKCGESLTKNEADEIRIEELKARRPQAVAKSKLRCCGLCHQPVHRKETCPTRKQSLTEVSKTPSGII